MAGGAARHGRAMPAFDLVVIADPRPRYAEGRCLAALLATAARAGYRTALLPVLASLPTPAPPFHPAVAALLAGGEVTLLDGERPHDAGLALVYHLLAVRDPAGRPLRLRVGQVVLRVDQPWRRPDGTALVDPRAAVGNAAALLGAEPEVVGGDRLLSEALGVGGVWPVVSALPGRPHPNPRPPPAGEGTGLPLPRVSVGEGRGEGTPTGSAPPRFGCHTGGGRAILPVGFRRLGAGRSGRALARRPPPAGARRSRRMARQPRRLPAPRRPGLAPVPSAEHGRGAGRRHASAGPAQPLSRSSARPPSTWRLRIRPPSRPSAASSWPRRPPTSTPARPAPTPCCAGSASESADRPCGPRPCICAARPGAAAAPSS